MLYHGSSCGGLEVLSPQVSEHEKAYVYFASNEVIAALYTVHIVGKPYSWFPYGFESGLPKYIEYYPDALADVYKGKPGFIYQCENVPSMRSLAAMPHVQVSELPVRVELCAELNDVCEQLLRYEKAGSLIIQRFETLTDSERAFADKMMLAEIEKHRLSQNSDNEYARFLKTRFPHIWERRQTQSN